MNKQELIDHCKTLKEDKNKFINCIDVDRIINTIKQLDESQKVKVPQFVADWIEYCKVKKITLAHALYRSEEAKNKSVYRWTVEGSGHQETFARAWLDGYEVEKEKWYLVRIKGVEEDNAFLNYYAPRNEWFMDSSCDMKDIRAFQTRKELEDAGFGWVFDCPGVEVQEVD